MLLRSIGLLLNSTVEARNNQGRFVSFRTAVTWRKPPCWIRWWFTKLMLTY